MPSLSPFRQELRAWWASRFGLWTYHFLALVLGYQLVRLVLLIAFLQPQQFAFARILQLLFRGFIFDLTAAFFVTLPLLFVFLAGKNAWFHRPAFRTLVRAALALFWGIQIFLLIAEFYFFSEFRSRFNTVAVDYLIYPKEVFVNIWDSYPVIRIVGSCIAGAFAVVFFGEKISSKAWLMPLGRAWRWRMFSFTLALGLALAALSFLMRSPVERDRTLSQIGQNGVLSFLSAAWTRNLDYSAFYPTIARTEAFERSRQLLAEPEVEFDPDPASLQRHVAGNPKRPRLNVVLMLEESLGSEFWGSLGRKGPSLTPRMDELAEKRGMLFDNLYATGNRTVRGFEGVLASFPPLPGDSIVKRDRSDHVETIARVLKRDGYETLFLYGGRGIFDGMRSFARNNGYDRFIEQKDFPHPTFTTAWGVCNEDLYDRTIQELDALAKGSQPFFATTLSVSNHRPYTFPAGRISENPARRWRDYAVKYTDWALGRFFDEVATRPYFTNTIFVVIADHGARVYGSQSIPIHSYEIPFLVIGPAVVDQPRRVSQLGSQLDVAPTILGLIGRPYEQMFFGRNLLHLHPEEGRIFVQHNRDIGMFRNNRMVVLNMNKKVEFYHGDPKNDTLARVDLPDNEDLALQRDVTAIFQTADELYMSRSLRLKEKSPVRETMRRSNVP